MDTIKFEKIKKEFEAEVEVILLQKQKEIKMYFGLEQIHVKNFHLDNLKQFAKILNIKINRIVDENKLIFKDQNAGDKFSDFMKPTFEDFYKKYQELAKPE